MFRVNLRIACQPKWRFRIYSGEPRGDRRKERLGSYRMPATCWKQSTYRLQGPCSQRKYLLLRIQSKTGLLCRNRISAGLPLVPQLVFAASFVAGALFPGQAFRLGNHSGSLEKPAHRFCSGISLFAKSARHRESGPQAPPFFPCRDAFGDTISSDNR